MITDKKLDLTKLDQNEKIKKIRAVLEDYQAKKITKKELEKILKEIRLEDTPETS